MAQAHAASGDIIDIRPLGAASGDRVSTALIKSAQLELMQLVLPQDNFANTLWRAKSP